MNTNMAKAGLAALAALLVAMGVALAEKPDGKGKSGKGKNNTGQSEAAMPEDAKGGPPEGAPFVFGPEHRDIVRGYFHEHPKSCPPGLAKKNNGCLPPGQAKKRYQVGHKVPEDVVILELPDILRDRLPVLPPGWEYREIDGDVSLIHSVTQIIVDAIDLADN